MTDTNSISIFLYNIPKFEKNKIYPINQCDLCCDISIVEQCPLSKCDYTMCGLCWNKIIKDSNTCPACRRELPRPYVSCCTYIENKCIENIDNMKIIGVTVGGIIILYVIFIFCLL